MVPLFFATGFLSSQWTDPHRLDFTHFWLAGHMNLEGLNVYGAEWVAERVNNGILWIPEDYFLYPLPLGVLLSPLGLLPFNLAYLVWVFVSQVCTLLSIIITMQHFLKDSPRLELITLAGIFLFRPFFIVIVSGQIDPYLLFLMVLSAYFFAKKRHLASGFLMSLLSIKPSLGIPILLLVGAWLLYKKYWKAAVGILSGLTILFLIGVVRNPYWVVEYLSVTQQKMIESYTLHSTLWGFTSLLHLDPAIELAFGVLLALTMIGVTFYLFSTLISSNDLFTTLTFVIPVALLIAPYAWVYNQILLTIPIIFILLYLSRSGGWKLSLTFLIGLDTLAIGLAFISFQLQHDVLSFLTPLVIWLILVYIAKWNHRHQRSSSHCLNSS